MKLNQIVLTAIIIGTPVASETAHQPYKGFETRNISSLSEADIEGLKSGTGWGLALPAELNGYPGPAHVLELANELDLSEHQRANVQAIYDAMKVEAIAKGTELIEAERQLDQGFKSGDVTPTLLKKLIDDAGTARADLRFVHLSRHLETIELLSAEQTSEYSTLRGYSSDPCQSVPEGHDAEMWRRHNGCDG
ncbi:unnamed protein product [Ectocarpus sp. 12 AP-2014]